MKTPKFPSAAHARGISLIEALVALVVMSIGMLALVQVQAQLRFNADVSRQRAEAVRFAQADMEKWRAFSVLNTTAVKRDWTDIASQAATSLVGEENLNTVYQLTRTVTESVAPAYKTLKVIVRWDARNGEQYEVAIESLISKSDPALSGQVATPPVGTISRNPKGRNIKIPTSAIDLGQGKSGFTPPGHSSGYYVLNNADATVIQYCTGAIADYVTTNSNGGCATAFGYTVSGFVNFDLRNNISAITPGSTVCDFYQDLQTGSSPLLTASPPTLDINSVMLDRSSFRANGGAARDYQINVVTLDSSTPSNWAVSVSLTNNLTVTLASDQNTNFNDAYFNNAGAIVLRVKGGSNVEQFTPAATGYNVANSKSVTPSGAPSTTQAALSVNNKNAVLSLNPTADLLPNTVYELEIPASSIALNRNGGSVDVNTAAVLITFSTGTAPVLATTNPVNGTQIASLSNNIVMSFDRPVVWGASGAITLYRSASGNGSWTQVEQFPQNSARVSISGNTWTIDPSVDLQYGYFYAVTISAGAIRDANGFSVAASTTSNPAVSFSAPSAPVVSGCPSSAVSVLNYFEVRTATMANTTAQAGTQFGGAWPYSIESSPSGAKAVCYSSAAASVAEQANPSPNFEIRDAIGYFCVIYMTTTTPFTWSGKINLWGPDRWLVDPATPVNHNLYKVCRYHDFNNDGTDSMSEHPATYSSVDASITDQNFLVINNNKTCPNEALNIGSPTNVTVYFNTAQYQP